MEILDLRSGQVVRTLIPKIAEGIFDVIAMFSQTNDYVLYYHSGRKTIRSNTKHLNMIVVHNSCFQHCQDVPKERRGPDCKLQSVGRAEMCGDHQVIG